mgnify:FL=1|tara:strand:- start:2512 stop:3525 length:1014 start_codon:yes stop_codon:yes gene_type:complete
MRFFNPKEEVIDIQLTQDGKRKLAAGRFKPKYYAFFDEDILYDTEYAGFDEQQKDSVPRIMDDTPRLRTRHSTKGVETEFRRIQEQKRKGDRNVSNETKDRNNSMVPLGTSFGNEFAPVWKISMLHGEFENTQEVNFYNVSWGTQPIPQLSSSMEVLTRVEFREGQGAPVDFEDNEQEGRPLVNYSSNQAENAFEDTPQVYQDGSYLVTEQPSIILSIAEINNAVTNENFEIEVFEIIQQTVGGAAETKEVLRPLFIGGSGDYSEKDEYGITEESQDYDPNYAQHYVEIFADGELDADAIDMINGAFRIPDANAVLGGISPYSGDGRFDEDDMKEPC